jgi:hypothetical protein
MTAGRWHKLATLGDAERLFELRRESITSLAPKGMTLPQAEKWAANLIQRMVDIR